MTAVYAVSDIHGHPEKLLASLRAAGLIDQPMLGLDADHLLMHSDTTEYVEWGDSIAEINAAARDELHSDDIVVWWEIWRRMTSRYAFRGVVGAEVAAALLERLGGR